MSLFYKIALTFGILALLGAGCAKSTSSQNQTSAEAVVGAFLGAVQEKNQAEAKAYVDPESELGSNFSEAWEEIGDLNLQSYSVLSTEGNEVKVEMTIEENGKTNEETETLEVTEKDGKWWIVEI